MKLIKIDIMYFAGPLFSHAVATRPLRLGQKQRQVSFRVSEISPAPFLTRLELGWAGLSQWRFIRHTQKNITATG